jgi:hypothetical protein
MIQRLAITRFMILSLKSMSVGVLVSGFLVNSMDCEQAIKGPSVEFKHGDLKVSADRRFLQHADGHPFFYLGDTSWELFHRLKREEAERYLENRRQKGFTVIQAVVLAELDGLNAPNPYGDCPLVNNDPGQPNESYFGHVDYIVDKALEKGIFIGMLPTWGDKVVKEWGVGPVIFNPANARSYGRFLGRRYKDRPNILWILGGDRKANGMAVIWRGMAAGLEEGDERRHLKTYHPMGEHSSSQWFQEESWLDFNMLQSGHARKDLANYLMVAADYGKTPTKPCMDGEPRYEDHPVNWDPKNGWFDDFDVRQGAYWALFAGAHGHTYGCHDIWQMMAPGRSPVSSARHNWYEVMDLPGAWDMQHVRKLLESRPFFTRIPDQTLLAGMGGGGISHLQACRGEDYLFVYTPMGEPVTLNLGRISGKNLRAWWFDPRTGRAIRIGVFLNEGTKEFHPPGKPGRGNDWVLVLDDASKSFPEPGKVGN